MQNARACGWALILVAFTSPMRADATLSYHTDIQTGGLIPPAALDQALDGMRDIVIEVKGNKARCSLGKITSIVDLTTQETILVDAANKRYASVPASEYAQQMKSAMPVMPAQSTAALSSIKSSFESHSTGRTASIQGIQAEEDEFVVSIDIALPNFPAAPSPFMKLVMQVWTATPEETQRVPALQEFRNYSAAATSTMNSTEMVKQILSGFPGMGDNFGAMMDQMSKKRAMMLRMHMELSSPFLASMSQQLPPGQALPAGLDPNAPLMQMNQEVSKLSSDPVDDAIFQVPAGYQAVSLEEILKSGTPQTALPTFQQ